MNAAVRKANRIIVLGEAGITEQGTHDELMARQGEYHKLYQAQFTVDAV